MHHELLKLPKLFLHVMVKNFKPHWTILHQ